MDIFLLIVSLPMWVCLFWLIYFTLRIRLERERDRLAIAMFFLASFGLYACHYMYFAGIGNRVAETIYATLNLCVYPLFSIYITRLVHKHIPPVHYVLYFLPAAVILPAYIVCFSLSADNVRAFFTHAAHICFTLQVLAVWWYGVKSLREFQHRLDNYYSDDSSYVYGRINTLVRLFGIISILSASLNFIGRAWFEDNYWVMLPALLMSIMLYLLGYTTTTTTTTLISEIHNEEEHTGSAEDVDAEREILKSKIQTVMKEERYYLNQDLTISDLAKKIGTNRTYLSNLINSVYGVNFNIFIAQYRVEHAKRILSDCRYENDKTAILDAIALSGFASENTFYRQFKQLTGQTPLVWRKEHLKL